MGRVDEAKAVIRKIARSNGSPLPDNFLASLDHQEGVAKANGANVLDLFQSRPMALRTLNMCYQWFAGIMCYFGLIFASTGFSGDAFTNFSLGFVNE